jgi:hypothetical protein
MGPSPQTPEEATPMRSKGGRETFELAQVYRAVYALRAAYDRQPVLSVAGAIAYGELLLRSGHQQHPIEGAALQRGSR